MTIENLKMAGHHRLYGELSGIVGQKYVSDDDFVLLTYSRDSSPMPKKVQGIVVIPGSIEEVSEVVKLANYARTPVVPSGGRAGMSGPSVGMPGRAIVVDLKRLDKIISINEDDLMATTQAGISCAEFSTKLNEKGYNVNTAYMPWYSDSVGGQLSGVPGGGAGDDMTRTGGNVHFIQGLKVVLPDGSVVQTGGAGCVGKNQTFSADLGSPNLTPMFLGAAGTFGIIVEATYRMFHPPAVPKTGMVAYFNNFEDIYGCYRDACAIEPMPYDTINLIDPYSARTAMMCPEGWMMTFLVSGNDEQEVEAKRSWARKSAAKFGGKFSNDPSISAFLKELCSARKWREMGSFASQGTYCLMEVYSSLGEVPLCYNTMKPFVEKRCAEMGLEGPRSQVVAATGPNIHVTTIIPWYDETNLRIREKVLDMYMDYYDIAIRNGWLPDVNQKYTCRVLGKYFSPAFFNFMRTIKQALDPNHIMNPGMWGDVL